MTDLEFVAAFESCSLPVVEFNNTEHVRLTWLYLKDGLALPETLIKLRDGTKRFAEFNGAHDKYHETITFWYVFLVHERYQKNPALDWDGFQKENPDLLEWPSVLNKAYSKELITTDRAKTSFVMPDL